MQRIIPLLLALLLLLSGCSLQEELLTEKRRINPIPADATALVFTGVSGTRTVSDPEVISALRASYRWTNYHLHCCLEGEVAARMTIIAGGSLHPAEPGKVYADPDVPSYNPAFRRLLRCVWESAPAD